MAVERGGGMEHRVQIKAVLGGWVWVCACGSKEGFPPFARKEHAINAGKKHVSGNREQ